jgi:hypothetical protein
VRVHSILLSQFWGVGYGNLRKSSPDDVRPRLVILGIGVFVALVLLYLANLFYIQSLLVVWGVAIILGTYIYDRRTHIRQGGTDRPGGPEKLSKLEADLASVEEKLSGSPSEDERRNLRMKEAALEQELRKLRWTEKEQEMEKMRLATGGTPLRALPVRQGFWQRRKQGKKERVHLVQSLDEALEAIGTESPEAARARLAIIAADLKAHYGALREAKDEGGSVGDYAAAWMVIYAVSRGTGVGVEVFKHVPRKEKSKLTGIIDLAVSRGVVGVSPERAV